MNFGQISVEVQMADDQGINLFFILSNSDTTPDCKDHIQRWNEKHRCRIIDLTGTKFLDLLFQLPNVCRYYFPDEEIPPIVDIKTPIEAITKSSELGNRFGIKLELKPGNQINLNNPSEVSDLLKDASLKLDIPDVNLRALIYQKISMFFFAIEKSDDAIMFLDKSLDITPKNIEALLLKGYILAQTDEIEKSNECFDEILKIDNKNKFALNNKASNLTKIGEFEEALKLINEGLKSDPNFIEAIINKSKILKSLQKSKDAIDFLDEKSDLMQKSLNLQAAKVDLYIDLLDLRKAYKLNEEILKIDPNHINSINGKGVIFERNAVFQKKEKYLPLALECFDNVTKRDDKYAIGWSNKVAVYINSGNKDDAEIIIDEALEKFPKNPYVLNKKGIILLFERNPVEALKYFNKALKLGFEEEFLINKARAQLILGQWEPEKRQLK